MEQRILTSEEYRKMLDDFFRDHPAPATLSILGKLEWHFSKQSEFDLNLANEGYVVEKDDDEDV